MLSGTAKKRQYIPIDAVVNSLPKHSAANLLPFHALTGCDNTSYFANHIKKSSWKVFKEHHQLLQNLRIGKLTEETIRSTEAFVCRIYDVQTDSVDAARHVLFTRTGKSEPSEALSPTSDALCYHLMRVHYYQAMVWRNANCPIPQLSAPPDMGWRRVESGLQPILISIISLNAIPESCSEMILCGSHLHDDLLQMSEIQITLHSNVCMSTTVTNNCFV